MKSERLNLRKPLLLQRLNRLTTDQEIEKQQKEIIQSLKSRIKKRKQYQKVVVGNQTTFDITQFFKFKNTNQPSSSIIDQVSGGYWAWIILLYGLFNNSLIQPWTISIEADQFLRLAWRHLIYNIILIPFILFQRRNLPKQKKQSYTFAKIFNKNSLKNAYQLSFSKALWSVVIMTTYKFTQIGHALILGSLMNFFLSILRLKNSNFHYLQLGGQIFVILGIFLIIRDEYWIQNQYVDTSYEMIKFLYRPWYIRVIADLVALFMSFFMAITYNYTTNLNKDYPSYLGMFVSNIMLAINLILASYFFHGATYDFDPFNGIFGVIGSEHFVSFFYMAIFLGFGLLWSSTLISRLFPQALIPSLTALFQPILSVYFIDYLNLQQIPDGYTFMGYLFIIPGMFFILVGQYAFKKKEQMEQKKEEQLLKTIVQLKNQRMMSKKMSMNIQMPSFKKTQSNILIPVSYIQNYQKKQQKFNENFSHISNSWFSIKQSLSIIDSSQSQEQQQKQNFYNSFIQIPDFHRKLTK